MKKLQVISFVSGVILVLFSLASCASLQQDVYTYTEENTFIYSSIEEYEERFINIDVKYQLENAAPSSEINELLKDIAAYKASTKVTEPALIARLRAFEGLLYKMSGRKREAEAAWTEAKTQQKGDRYVLLLGSRLAKNEEESLSQIEGILKYDSKNAVLQLEKGKLLYQQKKYDQAISVIDNAFVLFDNEGHNIYRTVYNPLRSYIWDLNEIYGSEAESDAKHNLSELQGNLTLDSLVTLTLENTSLLDNYRPANQKQNSRQKQQAFITTLERGGYFSSSADQKNEAGSSAFMTGAGDMTRKMCARFIWNAYIRKSGNLKMLSRYSEKYKKSGRTKSPVADISVEDADFDAVLGVVESEFMELPDGKNFEPELPVTKLQFINWIKKADK